MKTRKSLAVLITIAMVCSLLFGSSVAGITVSSLYLADTDMAGPGFDWDAGTKTLTLDGLVLVNDEQGSGIHLPADSTIILAEGSQNSITANDGYGIWAEGNLNIQGAGSMNIFAWYSGIIAYNSIDIDGLAMLEITAGADGLVTGFMPSLFEAAEEGSPIIFESADLTISNTKNVMISADENGIFAVGTVTIYRVDKIEILAAWAGIKAYDDLWINQVGHLNIDTGGDGIDLYGDLFVETVDLIDIFAVDDGIYLQGDLLMEDVDELRVIAGEFGIYATTRSEPERRLIDNSEEVGGNITLHKLGSVLIEADDLALAALEEIMLNHINTIEIKEVNEMGIWSRGAMTIKQITGSLKIHAGTEGYTGLGSDDSITLNDLASVEIADFFIGFLAPHISLSQLVNLSVEASEIGLLAMGSLSRKSVVEPVDIYEAGPNTDAGTMTLSDIASAKIIADNYGLVSFSEMLINNCSDLIIEAMTGEIALGADVSEPAQAAIIALGGPISIMNSTVSASGHFFGIMTGYVPVGSSETALESVSLQDVEAVTVMPYSGGDIIISRSFVIAQADAEIGYAGLFAGDNLDPDDPDKARIIIVDGSVIVPEEYWIVDVSIGETNSQSITDMAIELITDWVQAANYVEIAVDTYTVTYDANGGSGALVDPDSPYYAGDQVTVLDSTFSLEGYTFSSWNTAADGTGTTWQPGETFEILADVVLYAQYAEVVSVDTYTVTYDANGGSGALVDPDSPYDEGDQVTVLDSTFSLEGYTFSSWNTAADGTGTAWQPGETFEILADVVLYAQYAEEVSVDTYTVTYDANGGSGALVDPDSPYDEGDQVTVLASTFTLEGYTFSSWNTAADGTGTAWQPGETFEILADVVLYAQYAEVIDEIPDPDNGEQEDDLETIPITGQNTSGLWIGLLLLAAATTWLKKRLTA